MVFQSSYEYDQYVSGLANNLDLLITDECEWNATICKCNDFYGCDTLFFVGGSLWGLEIHVQLLLDDNIIIYTTLQGMGTAYYIVILFFKRSSLEADSLRKEMVTSNCSWLKCHIQLLSDETDRIQLFLVGAIASSHSWIETTHPATFGWNNQIQLLLVEIKYVQIWDSTALGRRQIYTK